MTINGKTYKMPELSFNAVCQLEDMGISLADFDKKPMAAIRGFLALAIGDTETAGRELEAHIVNGGDFTEIIGEISKAVQESGFFQALSTKQAVHSKESEKAEK